MTEQDVDKPVDTPVVAPVETVSNDVDSAERLAAQKRRNIWLALALFGFVIIVGLSSALRLAENVQRVSGG